MFSTFCFLAPYSTQRQKEIAICNLYKHAFRLLIAIDWCDEHNERPFKAILSRFLADLSLQPKHRVIAMRMAITNNLQSQNYGVAAKFIRVGNFLVYFYIYFYFISQFLAIITFGIVGF